MAFKSASFSPRSGPPKSGEKVSSAIEKHRPAMEVILQKAQRASEERRQAIDKITDPELRKSAAR